MLTYILQISVKILIIIWAIGFFLFGFGVFVHLILLMAIISFTSRYFINYNIKNKKIKHIKFLKDNN